MEHAAVVLVLVLMQLSAMGCCFFQRSHHRHFLILKTIYRRLIFLLLKDNKLVVTKISLVIYLLAYFLSFIIIKFLFSYGVLGFWGFGVLG